MFAATVKMASWLMSREYREPYGAPAAAVDRTPRAAGLAEEAAAAAKKAQDKPYEEAEYRAFPARRKPRGHLGGRAAAPAVRGVRPGRPDLRIHHRGDRLQDGDPRYDRLAHEFAKLLSVSFSLTATFGAS